MALQSSMFLKIIFKQFILCHLYKTKNISIGQMSKVTVKKDVTWLTWEMCQEITFPGNLDDLWWFWWFWTFTTGIAVCLSTYIVGTCLVIGRERSSFIIYTYRGDIWNTINKSKHIMY